MARHALLIGVSEFTDGRLARLNAPTNDVIALRSILQDSSRGSFDTVELSVNEDFLAVRDHLSRFFHDRAPDDLLLLYYSGHGILGRGNRLFLGTAGSSLDAPRDRSISAKEIREFIEDSRAERQIVVLDCCHSGAFAEYAKAAVAAPAVTPETFSSGDAGLYVLTAADALQFAWDGAELRTGNEAAVDFSRFTSWLVDGLEKGEAAPDDEQITMDALYRYLFRRARSEGAASTPQRFVKGGVGDLVISANPLAGSSQIDPEITAALAAEAFRMRLGAVAELALQMEEGRTNAARAARLILQRHLGRERDYQVRQAITKALAEEFEPPAEAAPSAGEEKQRAEAARLVEEEKRRAEAARPVEEASRRADTARLAKEEKQRADTARLAEEEKQRAESARLAAEEKRRAEAARQAKEREEQAEAARQAKEREEQAEAARQAKEREEQAEAVRQAKEREEQAEAARQRVEALRQETARQEAWEKQRAEAARRAEKERQRAEATVLAEEEKRRAEAARQARGEKQRNEVIRESGSRNGTILPEHLPRRWLLSAAGVLIAVTMAGGGYTLYVAQQHAPQKAVEEKQRADAAQKGTPDAPAVLQITKNDRILGNLNAPITIVEYASLTCPHCANFSNDILPDIKTKWINTGKAKLVFRDFPLDEPALRAAMVARCAPPERYYAFVDTFFAAQDKWARSRDYREALARLAKLGGMDQGAFETCIKNTELENKIAEGRLKAQLELDVSSTPTFFVNGSKFSAAPTVQEFDKLLASLSVKL